MSNDAFQQQYSINQIFDKFSENEFFWKWLKNYLMSFFDNILISYIISIIIVITRKVGINFNNKKIYITSKYIHNLF